MSTEVQSAYPAINYCSFDDLVRAEYEVRHPPDRGPALDRNATYEAFTKQFGPIVLSRFGENVPCGVALTDLKAAIHDAATASWFQPAGPTGPKRWRQWFGSPAWERRSLRHERKWWLSEQRKPVRLHLIFPEATPTNAQIVKSLSRCEKQAVYARRFLEQEDLRQELTLLYWPADALIARADAAAPGSPETADPPGTTGKDSGTAQLGDVITEQMDTADQYYQYFTQRAVRLQYFRGIGLGTLAVAVLCVLLYAFRTQLGVSIPFLWSVAAGALGALTSVLSSATFGRIVLDRPQGGTWNTMLGAFRPLIGSLFGVAFFALVSADFLPIKIPTGGGKVALYASIAFLAGFSHRWAQDTLKAAEGRIPAPPTPPEGQPAPGATTQPVQQKSIT